jgi:hypothetical protein
MRIVNLIPRGGGWDPINYMIELAAELFEAEVVEAQSPLPSARAQLWRALSRGRSSRPGDETCLLVCKSPRDLLQTYNVDGWRTRYRFIAAWVIDSFWTDWIPKSMRFTCPLDAIFVTSGEDVAAWNRALRAPARWLPWGTDVLRLGSAAAARQWDLTRVGRQPPEWDDDASNASAAAERGLRFHPRPVSEGLTPLENHRSLTTLYGDSRFVLAFSNLANPTNYTHPTRQYVTGRWADALGCGAVVAGCPPRGEFIDTLFWPGALLDLGTTQRDQGLQRIASAVRSWTPADARRNHAFALRRLDWRWRFQALADAMGETPARLAAEIELLKRRIEETQLAVSPPDRPTLDTFVS